MNIPHHHSHGRTGFGAAVAAFLRFAQTQYGRSSE